MIYKFLITIVFLSELIICLSIISILVKACKKINEYDVFLSDTKPLIKEMFQTIREISEKILDITPEIVNKVKSTIINTAAGQIKNMLGSITFLLVKREVEKHL